MYYVKKKRRRGLKGVDKREREKREKKKTTCFCSLRIFDTVLRIIACYAFHLGGFIQQGCRNLQNKET